MADVDEQTVAGGAAGYESVASLDALAQVTELHESGVIERLDLEQALARAARQTNSTQHACNAHNNTRAARRTSMSHSVEPESSVGWCFSIIS